MESPIFILSCARAGSTLLRYILDTHPEIYAPPELDLGALAAALAVTHAGLNGQRPSIPPLGALSPEVHAGVEDGISRLMDESTRRRGKSIWCEKAPPNMAFVDLLTTLYPRASYICLYRNHLDTIDSCLDSSRYNYLPPIVEHIARTPGNPLGAATAYWTDVTSRLLELERSSSFRTYRLRYEDLVRRPGETLAGLFSFLGLEWRGELVDAVYATPHDDGLGDMLVRFYGRINPGNVGRGRALSFGLVSDGLRARVEEISRELGYAELIEEILTVPAPRQPPAAIRGGNASPR